MSLSILESCDVIVGLLSAQDFGGVTVSAKRSYRSTVEAESALEASAYVVPALVNSALDSRKGFVHDFGIDIGIGRKLPPAESIEATNAAMDEMMKCVDAIRDHLCAMQIDSEDGKTHAHVIEVRTEPVFSPQMFLEHRQFVGVLSLLYRTSGE